MEWQEMPADTEEESVVVLETPEEIDTKLPWDFEDRLYEEWRDRQWERNHREEVKGAIVA
jgi:hypothetical protein